MADNLNLVSEEPDEGFSALHPVFAAAPQSVSFRKLRKRLVQNVREAIETYGMIEPGARWLVCLSGGKDSYTLLAILHAMAWVAGLAACSGLLFGHPLPATAFATGGAIVAGGALLGLGAVVNGACAIGAIARIGNGEWAWLATLPGLFVGALAWRLVPAALAPRAAARGGAAVRAGRR